MQHDVVISYSSKNESQAKRILAILEQAGIRCWISYRNTKPGENYMASIAAAIEASRAVVFVLCSHFNTSIEAHREVNVASMYGKLMIPVRTEVFDFSHALVYWVPGAQYVDTFPDFEGALLRVISRIKDIIPVGPLEAQFSTPQVAATRADVEDTKKKLGDKIISREKSRTLASGPKKEQTRRFSASKTPPAVYWFFNAGEGERRAWEDNRRFGFMSAGTELRFRVATQQLNRGDLVFAYVSGFGYVGFGEVTSAAVMIRDFLLPDGTPLLRCDLTNPQKMAEFSNHYDRSEWAVAIDWRKTLPREAAVRFRGMFAVQRTVCRLRDEKTLEVLLSEFV